MYSISFILDNGKPYITVFTDNYTFMIDTRGAYQCFCNCVKDEEN